MSRARREDMMIVHVMRVLLLVLLGVGLEIGVSAQKGGPLPPIEVQTLKPNLYLVTGAHSHSVVFVRSKDVVIIDTKGPNAGWGRGVAHEVKKRTQRPISTIINTSASGDHVAGNLDFAEGTVEIIAHEYALPDMRKMTLMFTKPTGGGLPTRTFKDRLTVGSGQDRLELYYFGPSTNRSGIFIVIPALRVLLTGDAFAGKFLPALTRPDGGNGVEFPNTLTKALPLARNVDMIVTGHREVAKPEDLVIHRDFMRDFLEAARRAKKAGLTAQAAARAWKVPPRYSGYEAHPDRVVGAMEWIYRQLP